MILFNNKEKIKWKRDNLMKSKIKKNQSSIPSKTNVEGRN
jgi:hypothetical protein